MSATNESITKSKPVDSTQPGVEKGEQLALDSAVERSYGASKHPKEET